MIVREEFMRSNMVLISVAAVLLLAVANPALADHGKAGLWQVTTKMNMPGMSRSARSRRDIA